ncbi:hypothetical protein PF005_g24306 [Phytophthora fragariae]|uniref:PH domain-containing protein n=1 Tax=Phytophthora fragariae TaxID=53985 RepID=A0A6A3DSX3_9STRA|nr:hypothetical protein PF003_g16077 [Phytophthora fragariae]KAE8925024.1 hypothetical protein PF009_g24757 [Phytophthora fragariae]KAE9077598.1 hypothetical protein PF010_g23453 [Phytophthora fragariae]KAE9077685.1 hypothetical protein PF007_g24152 [Phytophthora fragariae]KAE9098354.1 hypothetical protein PF006_g23374 [Phytophthora fragariae]
MTGLDCPMQTKALHLFWHKAELRLVEQPAPEVPVFAMSRPTLFGGREEFLLQYPARLEPPSERDIARHRFTVRHGKKRRSFQAPDAATFETWLSALEQALEPKNEQEHSPTPSSTSSNATTAVSSQGMMSTPGSIGTYSSSRGGPTSAGSNVSSQCSHTSTARAPPLRLTLERPCFTRDLNNFKLIWLHRPAWIITPSAEDVENDATTTEITEVVTDEIELGVEVIQEVSDTEDEDNDVLSVGVDDDALEGVFSKRQPVDNVVLGGVASNDADINTASVEDEFEDCELGAISDDEDFSPPTVIPTSPVNISKFEELADTVFRKAGDTNNVRSSAIGSATACETVFEADILETVHTGSADSEVEDVNSEVQAVVETLVSAVVEQCNFDEAARVDSVLDLDEDVEPEGEAAAEALGPAVAKCNADVDEGIARISDVITIIKSEVKDIELNVRASSESLVIKVDQSSEESKEDMSTVGAVTPRRFKKRSLVKSSKHSATFSTKHKWFPLDPTNSSLIWVRGSAEGDGKTAPRSTSRRSSSKSSRKWSPVDPSNTRLVWVQRAEAAARVESRYKATSSSRKWPPLEPDNSRYIWIRRQPSLDSSSSRVRRYSKQQC